MNMNMNTSTGTGTSADGHSGAEQPHTRTSSSLPHSASPHAAADTIDVRGLPSFGFSSRSLMWWATAGLMLIEGTVFALGVAAYFYLRDVNASWPLGTPVPDWRWGTLNTAILIASTVPNEIVKRAAQRQDLRASRAWLVVCLAFAMAFLAVRGMEFAALNVMWYGNAYGSIVWFLLGLHTTHLVTDTIDTAVLAALLYFGPLERKRFVDLSENALYWYFVVLSWLPIYAVIYLAPRFHP